MEIDITLTILAGGESSRMGASKAELEISGKPILEYLLNRIHWPGPTMLVTAPAAKPLRGAERFDRSACDPVSGVGPLRGILTALENAATPIVVITAVDMPMIAAAQVEWVAARLIEQPDEVGVLLSREMNGEQRVEPFPSAYRISAAPLIAEQLGRQRRAVHSLGSLPGFRTVEAPKEWSAKTWLNLNTPADLQAFLDQTSPAI